MKAALLTDFDGPLTIETVPDPTCPVDGAVISVRACGICRSDHHAWKGEDPDVKLPHVMGHEFAGVVEEVGANCTGFRPGDRVTAPFILGCGTCHDCLGGEPTICNQQAVIGFTGWGAFAERLAIRHADFNLVHIPDKVSFTSAAGMGCRVTTAFRAVVDRARLQPGEWLAVHGCGGVGLSAIMIGAALGARVIGVDVAPEALDLARRMGASELVDASNGNPGERIRDLTRGGAHVSVEALGRTVTFENSLKSLRRLGRHVQIGMPTGGHTTPPLPLLDLVYARQLSLHGTRGMAPHRFPALFGMITSGRMNIDHLVTKTIPLSQAETALRAMDGFQNQGITVIDRLDC